MGLNRACKFDLVAHFNAAATRDGKLIQQFWAMKEHARVMMIATTTFVPFNKSKSVFDGGDNT